jgi:Arylsulfotransferase (ASST)
MNRRQLLARGVSVGAGLLLGEETLLRAADAAAATGGSGVESYVTRPDLQPPQITVSRPAGAGVAPGQLFLAPSSGPGQRGVLIADNQGQPLWFHPTSPNTATNFRMALYKGAPVLTWWEGKAVHGLGVGEHVIFDRNYRQVARFPAGNDLGADLHELIVTPSGTALVTAWDIPAYDLSKLGGVKRGHVIEGIVQELAIPSARVLFEWRSLDHVSPAESYSGMNERYDYFHVNSIDLDADGNLLVSARNTWAVYKLDRDSGKVLWRLGGKKSDFKLGPGAHFAWQHDARHQGEGDQVITLFDNADSPQEEPQSRGLMLALDHKRKTATLQQQFVHKPPVLAHIFGSVQTLANGNVLVGWGASPYFTEYSSTGAVRYDAGLPHGGENYRTLRYAWQGTPAERPRLAARGGRLYASWNGATEVAAWRVRAGSSPTALEPALTVPRRGFETTITPPASARFAAVTALNRAGKPLRTSATVVVS